MGGILRIDCIAVCLLLLQIAFLGDVVAAPDYPVVQAKKFITSDISKFGLGIEGTSVDYSGAAYVTAYLGGTTSGLGQFASPEGAVQQEIYSIDQTGSISYNGLRFLPLSKELSTRFESRALGTDVRNHQVVHLLKATIEHRVRTYEFCGNSTMAQPNDIAVAAKSGRIYLSGGKFGLVNTKIGDGDLWLCQTPSSFYDSAADEVDVNPAIRLDLLGLTNGVELSPDERTLYLSEAFRRDALITESKIWKYDIDPSTGFVYNKTLFVDFQDLDGTGWIDVDGIRTDVEGNLYVVRNGPSVPNGGVVKLSPEGNILLRILLPGVAEPTNLDFAGVNGTTLYIAGKCADALEKGCIDVWEGNSIPGRAWAQLKAA